MTRNKLAIVLGATFLLAACGGGGGGSGSPSAEQTSNVSGVASKGLILNGQATAYRINGDGSKGAALQAVSTDGNTGAYQFIGLPAGVPVLVEVAGKSAPEVTRMKDEATGTLLSIDSAFKLRAATVTGTSGLVSLQVTPYSEMAVVLAEAAGGLSADNVQKANSKVVAFAGEDVISVAPVFDASGKALNAAAVKLAAVSQLASSGVVGASSCSGDTLAKVKCAVSQLALQGIDSDDVVNDLQAAEDTIKQDTDKVSADVAGSVQQVVKQTSGLPSGPAQTAIQTARSLVQSLRNLGASLGSQAPGGLRARLQDISQTTQALPNVLPDDLFIGIDVVARATEVLNRPLHKGQVGSVGQVEQVKSVRCVFTSPTALDCRRNLVLDGGVATQFRVQLMVNNAAVPTFNAVTSIVRQAGSFGVTGFEPAGSPVAISDPLSAVVSELADSADSSVMGTEDTLVLSGDLPLGVSSPTEVISGKAIVSLHVQEVGSPQAPTRYNLRGTLTQRVNGSDHVSLLLKSGSRIDEASTGVTNTVAMHLDMQADVQDPATAKGFRFSGVLDTSGYLPRRQDNLPGTVQFNGMFYLLEDAVVTKVFEGLLSATKLIDGAGAAATSGREGAISLSLIVPELSRTIKLELINLTEVVGRSPESDGTYTFTGTFNDGSNTVSFTGRDEPGEGGDYLDLRVVDVQTRLTPAILHGNVIALVRSGTSEVVGVYDKSKGQMTYADGSYERY